MWLQVRSVLYRSVSKIRLALLPADGGKIRHNVIQEERVPSVLDKFKRAYEKTSETGVLFLQTASSVMLCCPDCKIFVGPIHQNPLMLRAGQKSKPATNASRCGHLRPRQMFSFNTPPGYSRRVPGVLHNDRPFQPHSPQTAQTRTLGLSN